MAIITLRFVETVVIDTDTNEIISSVKTTENSEGVVAPTVTSKQPTKKVIKKEEVIDNSPPKIYLDDNKLILNAAAVELIKASVGDRICINYIQREDGTFVPVVGTQENMGDSVNGNKLTKALTVSFKGKQRDSLSQYGTNFLLKGLDDAVIASMYDPDHTGLQDIKEEELSPIPDVEDSFLSIPNISENADEDSVDFDFNFDSL